MSVIKPHDQLRDAVIAILTAAHSSAEEAAIVADHLVEANLRGHDSHGVGMIPTYIRNWHAGHLVANQHADFVRVDGVFGVADGRQGYGQVVAREAMDWAIDSAKRQGIGVVTLRNAHHIGRIGTYGEQACAAGMISLHFVNVLSGPPRVAAFRGSDGRTSTNPVCIAIPAGDGVPPIVLDFATSKIALGKVRVAYNEGHAIADNTIIDAAGQPTNDPAVMYNEPKGAMLPFGEHKGSGLALICELLGGGLTGGGGGHPGTPNDRGTLNGMLAIVLDPARLVDVPWFQQDIADTVEWFKASPPRDPQQKVLVAGEPERIARRQRLEDGIAIDTTSWGEIVEAARSVGVVLT
jgi:uncharacterized oxidoreductase